MKKGKKGLLTQFKEFINKGNVVDMAVGVIIGAAFKGIIDSLVNDIIMPVISLVTGGVDFTNWFIALDGNTYETLALAQEAGAATLNYGTFLTVILNFLLMAFVVFLFVKALNSIKNKMHKPEEPVKEEPKTKVCPYCKTEIAIDAVRCPHCTSELEPEAEEK